jgi:hypothetical protein
MAQKSTTGATPHTVGQCTNCGKVYPLRRTDDGGFRPIGQDGTCSCGHDEFSESGL